MPRNSNGIFAIMVALASGVLSTEAARIILNGMAVRFHMAKTGPKTSKNESATGRTANVPTVVRTNRNCR